MKGNNWVVTFSTILKRWQWWIFSGNQGAEVVNFPSILEVCQYLSSICAIHKKRACKKIEFS